VLFGNFPESQSKDFTMRIRRLLWLRFLVRTKRSPVESTRSALRGGIARTPDMAYAA